MTQAGQGRALQGSLNAVRRIRLPLRSIVKFLISAVCLALVPFFVPVQEIGARLLGIEPSHLVLAFVLIALNTALSSLRFHGMMRSFDVSATLRSAHKINVFSQIVGVFALQTIGQMIFRTAYGGQFVANPQRLVLLTVVEKGIALLTMSLIGLVGSFYITRHIGLDEAGAQLVIACIAIFLSLAFSYLLALTAAQRRLGRQVRRWLTRSGFERAALLSFVMHGLMLLAYIAVASGLMGGAPVPMIAALFSVVMLGAALPISFAGWGIRELSAGFVFTALGYDPSIGIVVAATIGIVSLAALGAHAIAARFISKSLQVQVSLEDTDRGGEKHFERLVALFCGLGIAIFIGFQLRVPTNTGALTVNLADPIALVGALSFVTIWCREYLHQPMWRLNGLAPAMCFLLALITYGWVLGYFTNGFSSWATYNRGVGYFVLLAYLFAGSMVTAFFGRNAVRSVIRVFLVTNICILILYVCSMGFLDRETLLRLEWRGLTYSGLIGNRNALSFAFAVVLAVSLAMKNPIFGSWRPMAIAVTAGLIVISSSRTGMIVAALAIAIAVYARRLSPKELAQVTGVACVVVGLFYLANAVMPTIYAEIGDLAASIAAITSPQASGTGFLASVHEFFAALAAKLQVFENDMSKGNWRSAEHLTELQSERFSGYWVALDMWLAHPIFGAGMGAFVSHYLETKGVAFVIHNSVFWILTEMGILGVLLFLPLPWAILAHIRRKRGQELPWDDFALLLCLIAVAVFTLAHDMLYQRVLWFMLGILAANKLRLTDTLTSRMRVALPAT